MKFNTHIEFFFVVYINSNKNKVKQQSREREIKRVLINRICWLYPFNIQYYNVMSNVVSYRIKNAFFFFWVWEFNNWTTDFVIEKGYGIWDCVLISEIEFNIMLKLIPFRRLLLYVYNVSSLIIILPGLKIKFVDKMFVCVGVN